MAELANTNAIEYYLKGRAIREAREQHERQLQMQQLNLEARRDQMEQSMKQFESRLKETRDYHKSLSDAKDRAHDLALREYKLKTFKGLQDRTLEFDPDNPSEVRPTALGSARAEKAALAADVENARTGPLVQRAEALLPVQTEQVRQAEGARLPGRMHLLEQQGRIALDRQRDQQRATAEQNELNRQAAMERTNLAWQRGSLAKKEEKELLLNDAVETHIPEVMSGNMTMEDLNKTLTGEAKIRFQNEVLKRGVTFIKTPDKEVVTNLSQVQSFLERMNHLKDHIASFSDPRLAAVDPEYLRLKKELQQDLDAWGRAVKGMKGPITERDTERTKGGIPAAFPGGPGDYGSAKSINEANQRRVESVEDFIQEKFDLVTGSMKPEQREAVRKRFQIISPNDRQLKKNKSKDPLIGTKAGADWK